MGDDKGSKGYGLPRSRWVRRLVLASLGIGTVVAARRWAIERADAEFERRLIEADRTRD